jgi:HK97 family phage major capsid protein
MPATDLKQVLTDRRNMVFEQEKALAQRAADEQRSFTGEEDRQWRELDAEVDALDARIKDTIAGEQRAKDLADSMENLGRARAAGGGRPGSAVAVLDHDTELRRFLTGETRSYELRLPMNAAERAQLMLSRAERRSILTDNVPIPETFIAQLYSYIVDTSSIRQASPRVFSGTSGEPLTVPRSTAEGSAVWVAEGAPLSESDPTLDAVTLNSHKVGKIVEVSSEMLADEGFDLTGFIAESAGRNIGIATDKAYLDGTGVGQPLGLLRTATVAIVGTGTGGDVGYPSDGPYAGADALISLFHSVLPGYRVNASWLMNDATVKETRKLKDLSGRYLWEPALTAGDPDRILGKPVYSDPNMPEFAASNNSIAFGDFGGYWIRDVSPVRFERSDDYRFGTDMVSFRTLFRTDGKQGDTQAIAVYQCGPAAGGA